MSQVSLSAAARPAKASHENLFQQTANALNKFLTEYNWDDQQFNDQRLENLQKNKNTPVTRQQHRHLRFNKPTRRNSLALTGSTPPQTRNRLWLKACIRFLHRRQKRLSTRHPTVRES